MKKCNLEGCEMPHCRECGRHYDLYCAGGMRICDSCQIERAANEAQMLTEAFDGNYEEAARFMGW